MKDIKSPFEFNITSPLPAIASGLLIGARDVSDGKKLYAYEQDVPIPSNLFALASGNIAQVGIGPRSAVATYVLP